MGKSSKIEWTHATFNPWIGCTKVSPGCEHCYAEAQDKRWGHKRWGPTAPRTRTSKSYWAEPLLWNKEAKASGQQFRVFCASLADVCEDRDDLLEPRADLMRLIEQTPYLTWLLLTKRPENFVRFFGRRWTNSWPLNVWAMATVVTQKEADTKIPELLMVPAAVRGLSMEPLIERVVLRTEWLEAELQAFGSQGVKLFPRVDWVIVGGETGSRKDARPMHPGWARDLRDQCVQHDVAYHFKQWGNWAPLDQPAKQDNIARLADNEKWWNKAGGIGLHGEDVYRMAHIDKHVAGRNLDGRTWDEFPAVSVKP
jgi:protein gp37